MKYAFTVLNAAVLKLKLTQVFFFVFQTHEKKSYFFIDVKLNQYFYVEQHNKRVMREGDLTGVRIITLSEPIILSSIKK